MKGELLKGEMPGLGARIDVNHFSLGVQKSLGQVFLCVCMVARSCVALDWPWRTWFFSIVSSGDSLVLPQITASHQLGKPTTAASLWNLVQEALKPRELPQQLMMTLGGSTLARSPSDPPLHVPPSHRPGRRFLSIQAPTRSSPGECQAGKEKAAMLNKDVRPNMSQRSLPPSTAERQSNRFCWRCTQTRTYYVRKHK